MADRAVCIGPPAPGDELPEHPVGRRRREHDRLRGRPPGLRVPRRAARVRPRLHGQRPRLRRPGRRRDGADGRQGAGEGGDARGRRPARPRHRGGDDARAGARARARDRLPGAAQGGGRRRGARHAARHVRPTSSRTPTRPPPPRRDAAFGDGSLYVEKALVPARHVEIQVLADATAACSPSASASARSSAATRS